MDEKQEIIEYIDNELEKLTQRYGDVSELIQLDIDEVAKEFQSAAVILKNNNQEFSPLLEKLYEIGSNSKRIEKFLAATGITLEEFQYMNSDRFIKALEEYENNKPRRFRQSENHTMINDRYTNGMLQELVNGNGTGGDLFIYHPFNEDDQRPTRYEIMTTDDTELKEKGITEYDIRIINTVASVMERGYDSITLSSLYKEMTHNKKDGTANESQLMQLWKSLRKLSTIRQYFEYEDNKQIGDTLLSFIDFPNREYFGNTEIRFKNKPILYLNAKYRGQLITIPADLLQIRNADKAGQLTTRRAQDTPERIAIQNYMLRRISMINEGLSYNTTILYDTVIDTALNRPELHRQERARLKEYIGLLCTNWKAAGFIQGYKLKKKSNQLTGVEIIPKVIKKD